MKAMIKKIANTVNLHEEEFSHKGAIAVVALLITFVGTTVYLMITCYNNQ